MATESLREIAERLNRLAANPDLIERYKGMHSFPDGTAWASMSLRNALEFALYQQPNRMSDACWTLRMVVADVEKGWRTSWWWTQDHKRLCAAVEDVLAGRWPKKVDVPEPPKPAVHTCEMKEVVLDGASKTMKLCGKPVNATAPNRNGHWLCESCIAGMMKADNANWYEQKRKEIERLKSEFSRPFKSPYLIGTGDLHGPKLL
jgi:hypothetical protein